MSPFASHHLPAVAGAVLVAMACTSAADPPSSSGPENSGGSGASALGGGSGRVGAGAAGIGGRGADAGKAGERSDVGPGGGGGSHRGGSAAPPANDGGDATPRGDGTPPTEAEGGAAGNEGSEAGQPGSSGAPPEAVAGTPGTDGTDAGSDTADAGSETTDAGSETTDAGSETTDAGSETTDAGSETTDAGGETTDAGSDGEVENPCSFTVSATPSTSIPTVVAVAWTTSLPNVATARVVYELSDGPSTALNRGGAAPAELGSGEHRTLLVGLKPSQNYTFHVEATSASGTSCRSADQTLATGALADVPTVTRHAVNEGAVAGGFIVTCGGFGSSGPAVMIDADGDVVWSAPAPVSCSRARLDYAAKNVWMLATNPSNTGGDLRVISLDGQTTRSNIAGLERAHHDLVALEDGSVAVFAWSASGRDPESDLIAVTPDGTTRRLFHVGSNLYAGGQSAFGGNGNSYHCNSVTRGADGSFTIGDRNPNLFVHVDRDGTPLWQFGGTCSNARAPLCAAGTWQINHGHHLLDDGTFVFFNNTGFGASTASNALEFELTTAGAISATPREQWPGTAREHSDTLGDVQRLPNGNTLVTFSNNGMIYELDPAWNVVQTLAASSFGYSEWRPTLYGAPSR